MKLKKISDLVFEELKEDPATRNSDYLLYIGIVTKHFPGVEKQPLGHVFKNINFFGLPTFESVRRARQKIQAEHLELLPTEETERKRRRKEKEYREFVKI